MMFRSSSNPSPSHEGTIQPSRVRLGEDPEALDAVCEDELTLEF